MEMNLLYKAGVLHRAISVDNLIINEDTSNPCWPALLIDLDLGIKEARMDASRAKDSTGTGRFKAIGILFGEEYTFMHDLEAFFWVLF